MLAAKSRPPNLLSSWNGTSLSSYLPRTINRATRAAIVAMVRGHEPKQRGVCGEETSDNYQSAVRLAGDVGTRQLFPVPARHGTPLDAGRSAQQRSKEGDVLASYLAAAHNPD
jgi:hypothetical protein